MASKPDELSPPRHILWYRLVYGFNIHAVLPIFDRILNVRTKKCREKIGDASFIVYNHGHHCDFSVPTSIFRKYSRCIMTDAAARKPLPRLFLNALIDPIFRRKGEKADAVVRSAELSIDKGINILLAPEGNLTQNGETGMIRPRTGAMIKESGAGMITIRISGSYLKGPFWARNKKSKGPMFGELVRVYTKEVVAEMTADEINEAIARDLFINHYEWNRKERIAYDRKDRAECMERVAYMCPKCRSIGQLHSRHDTLSCGSCGYSVDVDEYGFFVGDDVVFDNLCDWDKWQTEEMRSRREEWIAGGDVIVSFDHISVKYMKGYDPVTVSNDATVSMSAKEVRIKGEGTDMVIPTEEIVSFTSLFADTLSMTYGGISYQLRSAVPISNRILRNILKILREEEF